MKVAFIVNIELEDPSMAADTAVDIEDDLVSAGFDVVSVQPWARPAMGIAPAEEIPPMF